MTITETTVDFARDAEADEGNGHEHGEPKEKKRPYKNRLEIWKPPTDDLEGYFDVTVSDPNGVPPPGIIKATTPWRMHFSIWLLGDIWKCVSGTLCYEVYFERANDGQRFVLSELVDDDLRQKFEGCEVFKDGRVHLSYWVDIPAGTLPPGDLKPGVYDWKAVVAFQNACGEMGVIAGHDKGHVQIYSH